MASDTDRAVQGRSTSKWAPPLPVGLAAIVVAYWTMGAVSSSQTHWSERFDLRLEEMSRLWALLYGGHFVATLVKPAVIKWLGPMQTIAAGGALLAVGSLMTSLDDAGMFLTDVNLNDLWVSPSFVLLGLGMSLIATVGLDSLRHTSMNPSAVMNSFGITASIGIAGGFLIANEAGSKSVFLPFTLGLAILLIVGSVVNVVLHRSASDAHRFSTPLQASAAALPQDSTQFAAERLIWDIVLVGVFVPLPLLIYIWGGPVNRDILIIATTLIASLLVIDRIIRVQGALLTLIEGVVATTAGAILTLHALGSDWLPVYLVLFGVGQAAVAGATVDVALRRGDQAGGLPTLIGFAVYLWFIASPWVVGKWFESTGHLKPFYILLLALPTVAVIIAALYATQRWWCGPSARLRPWWDGASARLRRW
jgi:hypothetical protein